MSKIHTLLGSIPSPQQNDRVKIIATRADFLTPEECGRVIALGELFEQEAGTLGADEGQRTAPMGDHGGMHHLSSVLLHVINTQLLFLLSGMLIGALLTPCNIYSGLKIGWSFNVSIAALLLATGFWALLGKLRVATMVVIIVLACGGWAFLRSDGLDGAVEIGELDVAEVRFEKNVVFVEQRDIAIAVAGRQQGGHLARDGQKRPRL